MEEKLRIAQTRDNPIFRTIIEAYPRFTIEDFHHIQDNFCDEWAIIGAPLAVIWPQKEYLENLLKVQEIFRTLGIRLSFDLIPSRLNQPNKGPNIRAATEASLPLGESILQEETVITKHPNTWDQVPESEAPALPTNLQCFRAFETMNEELDGLARGFDELINLFNTHLQTHDRLNRFHKLRTSRRHGLKYPSPGPYLTHLNCHCDFCRARELEDD